MSSPLFRKILAREAEEGLDVDRRCFASPPSSRHQPQAIYLSICALNGETWMLPWHRFDSLRHFMDESGERLVLQFAGCEVTLIGANFGEIMELIAGNRLEWVRDLPADYRAHKKPEEPFIERLEVRTLDADFTSSS